MPEKVTLQLDSLCVGVTDERGKVFRADKRGDVTIPHYLANDLKASGAVRTASRKFFGGTSFSRPSGE
jgi:hypothetical protein